MGARRLAARLSALAVALCAVAVAAPAAGADPVLAAAGDIACQSGTAPSSDLTQCQQGATESLIQSQSPDAVATLGDDQYEDGSLTHFNGTGAYNDTWGAFNPIVHPAPGNHEYGTTTTVNPTASGYFTYFGNHSVADGDPNGYYSYDLGSWHLISLNSNCNDSGCQNFENGGFVPSAEVSWLHNDLAAHPGQCVLAYWHHPRFTAGIAPDSTGVAPLWTELSAAHADVVLNGHDHLYERFGQQDPSENATSQGIREFVVGTGGRSLNGVNTPNKPNLQVTDTADFGALFLTLHPTGYDWSFIAAGSGPAGFKPAGTIIDSGSTPCNPHPVPPTPPPPPPPPPPPSPPGAPAPPPAVVAPTAATGPASAISANAATLTGSINPDGSATNYTFQYGTASTYGLQTAVLPVGAGSASVAVNAALTGLHAGRTYHFRLVAVNAGGTSNGPDRTFTTLKPVPRALTATVTPRHARRRPFRFTFSGKLVLPSGIAARDGCKGSVAIQVKSARKTVLSRHAGIVGGKCTYRLKVVFGSSAHLKPHGKLGVTVTFLGNAVAARRTDPVFSIFYG